jgi:DNA polymerase III gamma/tau subunit
MGEHTKNYESVAEMMQAAQAMRKFQTIHNVIRKDYMELLRITEQHKVEKVGFDALYRASLRSLFSLIEADISGLNALDNYPDYNDRDALISKFKKTYKQIAKTWQKEAIQQTYFDGKLQALLTLKTKRDELVHPKEHAHIHEASGADFNELQTVFNDYDCFVNELMKDFFVGTSLKMNWGQNG